MPPPSFNNVAPEALISAANNAALWITYVAALPAVVTFLTLRQELRNSEAVSA